MKQEREGGQDRAGVSKVADMSMGMGATRRHVLKVSSLVMIQFLSPYLYDRFVTTRDAFMFRFSIHTYLYTCGHFEVIVYMLYSITIAIYL